MKNWKNEFDKDTKKKKHKTDTIYVISILKRL